MARFYTKTCQVIDEVKGANGKYRPVTIRDFRKNRRDWVPSVTTILSQIAKPGLEIWKIEQAILSAITLPRNDGESDQEFMARVKVDMYDESRTGRDKGGEIHNALDHYLRTGEIDKTYSEYIQTFINWHTENVAEVLGFEEVVTTDRYGGRYDLKYKHVDGSTRILDFKTQNVKGGKFKFYDEWLYQLCAYGVADCGSYLEFAAGSNCYGIVLESYVINVNDSNSIETKLYSTDQVDKGIKVFNSLVDFYYADKGL